MKQWISFPRTEGKTSRQAHCDLPEDTFEREFGREGFFGPASHLYHKHPPTGWSKWEGKLRPHAYDCTKITHGSNCPFDATLLLYNAHFKMRLWQIDVAMEHLACNTDGDELLFIHKGRGNLLCDFGQMPFHDGDYIMLPRCTRWRIVPSELCAILLMEATNDGYRLPDKGPVGPHAIFDPAMLQVPHLDELYKSQQSDHEEWQIVMKHDGDQTSIVTYPFNPLDVVGWKGDNLPVKINWRDIRPLMSHRYHLPPSAHTTFLANRFVVCTFCPRPIESDPGALKVPFYHSNNDYDEILFYHAGDFFSRDNIHPGMVTHHPTGFPHGPHPKAFKAGQKHAKKETDEVAVMIDTRDRVYASEAMERVEWEGYVDSWKDGGT